MLCRHLCSAATRYAVAAGIALSVIAFCQPATTADYLQVIAGRGTVHKVYVGSFGGIPEEVTFHNKLVRCLRKERGLAVVARPEDADAIITGRGKVWLKDYIRTNPKPGPWNRVPMYDGFLSLEVKGRDSHMLWSFSVRHRNFTWDGILDELTKRAAKQFQADRKESVGR